ncbi:MAG TPA: phosphoenolpyruvate--protein phosphotransferase [Ktedonobacterales bacterium]
MLVLDRTLVRLNAHPANKEGAIREVGALLVDAGYIAPAYVNSMLGREQEANTYLGNGIAIPHGMLRDKEQIRNTGIAVLQAPQGVEWNPGETAYLVVGIAARSDEHLTVLANLTDVLSDPETIQRLTTTNDANVIIERLNASPGNGRAPAAGPLDGKALAGKRVTVTVRSGAGLHARPATNLVNLSKTFGSEIHVRYQGKTADAKSLVSLLKLGASSGSQIEVIANGPDEDAALSTLQSAIESGLGEGPEEARAPEAAPTAPAWTPKMAAKSIAAIPASPGLAIGPLYQYKRSKVVIEDQAKDPIAEQQHLSQAIEGAKAELHDLYNEVKERTGAQDAAIFQAHAEFLDDPDLLRESVDRIQGGHSAAWAWSHTIDERAAEIRQLGNPLLANRAVDLRDVGQRVLRFLGAVVDEEPQRPTSPIILIAEDLTPSDTASLDPSLVLGFCTAGGGPTSHTAIIARSLDIPAIVGAGPVVLKLATGTQAVLDGNGGALHVEPSEADVASARQLQRDMHAVREAEKLACYQPAITTDGHRVEVVANVGKPSEAEQAVNAGGEGIGLFRTEFLFLERQQPPSEDEQFEAYREVVRALNGLPAIIRTLDIGGDKSIPYLRLPEEDNPFLGVRGIRLCLAHPELFKPQLRAIFRAAEHGPIRIMYPMIATLEDLRAAKAITEEVRQEIGAKPLDIGIMIEVPSAVIMAPELASEVSFFSIGTNDLTQYVLAMDRGHPMLAKQADGLHPAVLRMIDATVRAANSAGKWVGVCGGVAGDPLGALILAGLGVHELSVAIPSIAAVKAAMRRTSLADARTLAQRALACGTAAEVRALHPTSA